MTCPSRSERALRRVAEHRLSSEAVSSAVALSMRKSARRACAAIPVVPLAWACDRHRRSRSNQELPHAKDEIPINFGAAAIANAAPRSDGS